MSFDAGGLAQMTYQNNNNNNGFPSTGLGVPGSGFGARSRLSSKRLSVALPPRVEPISEHQVDNPTPRTSRSHLLAGLRKEPRSSAVPASAPYNQTQHQAQGLGASRRADQSYNNHGYNQRMPQTASAASFDMAGMYGVGAGEQTYSLSDQVLAPPSMYESPEEYDPAMLQQIQMTRLFLAQRQQQLQQQHANITAAAQGMDINGNAQYNGFQQMPMTPQTPQNYYGQQQMQSPIEVPGQPGLYLVYNPAIQGYSYVFDNDAQLEAQSSLSPQRYPPPTPSFSVSPPPIDRDTPTNSRSFTPPKKAPSPSSALEHVEPLPPPSATAFRRGHKKACSLAIDPLAGGSDGPKTSSAAVFGSSRGAIPAGPMTGGFGPGAARAGEHPTRQPRGPPPLEELTAAPTSKHEGSKNFATRQRRRALDSLMRAGIGRRGLSRGSNDSPTSDGEGNFSLSEEGEELASVGSAGSRKMSPIGSEMKEKRGSQGSSDGYFGLSSASSSETEDFGAFKQPPTPATPAAPAGDRKNMMLGVLNAAEKRKSFIS